MFSMSKAAQYVDVLAPKTGIDSGLMTFFTILIIAGFLTALVAASLNGRLAFSGLILGIALALGGVVGTAVQGINSDNARQEITKGMVSNVKEKYHADLETDIISDKSYSDLSKINSYVLTFENGASGEYNMKFTKSGEAVVVDATEVPTAPSVQELNGGEPDSSKGSSDPTTAAKPVGTTSPKSAPTPDELEKSSK